MNQDINCANFKGLLAYLRKNYGDQGVNKVLKGLIKNRDYLIADKYDPAKLIPVTGKHLTDSSYWVSNEFSMKLLANVKKVVPGTNPLYNAGEECIVQELSRNFLFFVKIFGVKFLARQATKVNAKFNRTKEARLIEMGANYVLIELRYKPDFVVSKDICNWNRGIYAGIARVTGLKNVSCDELKCVVEGDDCCMLRVTWKKVNMLKRFKKWLLKKFIKDLLDDIDVTERKKAEETQKKLEAQLLQAQKMEAVGTLAGGIAHDFNNLLQGVQGYVELILLKKRVDDPGYTELQEITRTIMKGKELTRQLLTLSRKVEGNFRYIDINDEIDNVKLLLERTILKMIKIELQLERNLKKVKGDPIQIEQVLMNIAVNARDAMGDEGTLTIKTKNVNLDREFCRAHAGISPGEYVLLEISDTGHGMDEKTLKRIFEPFYTTKEVGKGTGLGLAMVFSIVRNHGGCVICSSQPGKGTCFSLYFPVVQEMMKPPEKKKTNEELRGNETILLVDDEDYILKIGEELLTMFGYRVFTLNESKAAIEFYRKKKDSIDLVILDYIMPVMGGKRCLKEFLKINPQAKIIISTGYSVNSSKKEILEAGARGFVSKPFVMRQLLQVTRIILDEEN